MQQDPLGIIPFGDRKLPLMMSFLWVSLFIYLIWFVRTGTDNLIKVKKEMIIHFLNDA